MEIDVVPLVVDLDKARKHGVPLDLHPHFEEEEHPLVGLRGADAIDAGDAGHDDDVPPLQQEVGRGVAELVDLLVDRGVFLDVGIGTGDVGLGLVVVVIADKVGNGIVRKEGFELPVKLGGEGLVVGDDEGGPVHGGDHVRHREGLSGPGHAEENLVRLPVLKPLDEAGDRLRLIPPRLKLADQTKPTHKHPRVMILSQFPGDGKGAIANASTSPAVHSSPPPSGFAFERFRIGKTRIRSGQ